MLCSELKQTENRAFDYGTLSFYDYHQKKRGADSVLCSSSAYASWNTWNSGDRGRGRGPKHTYTWSLRVLVCVLPVRKKRKIIRIHSGIILTHRCHIKSDRRRSRRRIQGREKKIKEGNVMQGTFLCWDFLFCTCSGFSRVFFLFRDHGKYEEKRTVRISTP